MVGFFIKKAFFDGWDNLIGLVVHNLGFLLVFVGAYGGMSLMAIDGYSVVGIIALVIISAVYSFYCAVVSWQTCLYADYKREGFRALKEGFSRLWRHGVLHFFINTALILIVFFVLPFYFLQNTTLAFIFGMFVFWVFVIVGLAMQYFFPLACRMSGDRPMKTFRKCFILLADNLGFSLFLIFHGIISGVLSLVLVGLTPGTGGILLSRQVAVKLLMFKYDYLEEHPETDRKHIPWEDLLFDEREKVGHRSIKNMIFPWKD
ncbi:hypothetical protein [Parasphaerochaeta coccoides]|uniref:Uncharacterized protein n=1 Tax=Parasphaerochaeta coccoides (strain ATCC BAA-1237 / DSM 17374 / SPN1) TaxID=760011 RepID=F4GLI9_PARC1|nr:hypothetical protein [Parasphaerochaeta coccoides]AEC01959.1 hypothetical protein Spico_0733 [Parasphaerochaeta coccoides DSM 17374]